MASVYKRSRDRQRKGACWYITYTDHNDKRQTLKGCPDKAATEAMARKLESEAELRRRGVIDAKDDAYARHEASPLADHLSEWRAFLLAKGASQRHAVEGHARIVKLTSLAKAERLSDLSPSSIQKALAVLKGRGLSLRTIHHYVRLAKNFSKWAWHDGRTREDNLAHLRPPDNPETDRRRERRALTPTELVRLVETAEQRGEVRNLSGPDRAMLYRIAAGTGFRSEELQSLTRDSFDLDGEYPTITVQAVDSKRRRRDVQPIQPALAALLRPWLATKPNSQPIFPVDRWAFLAALQADLKAAGIEYKTDEGYADFHALRHSYITALAKSNAPVKIVQTLARHSTPALTLGVYAHVGLYDQASALDALPDLTRPAPGPEHARKTGTDDMGLSQGGSALPAPGQRGSDVSSQDHSDRVVITGSHDKTCTLQIPAENTEKVATRRGRSGSVRMACTAGSVSVAGARPGLQNR